MEIGEAVAVLIGKQEESPRPYCVSDADPVPRKKERINDASVPDRDRRPDDVGSGFGIF